MKITATLPAKKEHTGNIRKNRKEKNFGFQYTVLAIGNGNVKEIIVARLYNTPSRSSACVWINDSRRNLHISGGGSASGYGYHRASEAIESALNDAGVTLSEAIGGRGDDAVLSALMAVAREMLPAAELIHIVEAHA